MEVCVIPRSVSDGTLPKKTAQISIPQMCLTNRFLFDHILVNFAKDEMNTRKVQGRLFVLSVNFLMHCIMNLSILRIFVIPVCELIFNW